ncbi:MAG: hypothetical protein KKH22_09895 [Proteobacteria bacterium]|nr:hypothetical protein [Pseudomonadota bacterium]
MKIYGAVKRIVIPTQAVLLVLLCVFWATGSWAMEKEEDGRGGTGDGVISQQKNYTSLTGLVAMVGSDAMEQMHGFFAAEPVAIEPFIVLSEFSTRQRVSLLGATLAEQMAAVISNESLAVWRSAAPGENEQRVSGILQEVDGYLRIHIIAANTRGERRSYVVNVEMSEPIYRALHSYVYMQ